MINLGNEFHLFWREAKSKDFAGRKKAWNDIIEGPRQAFYDAFVWQKRSNPSWGRLKEKALEESFAKYENLAPKIEAAFADFESTLKKQLGRFQQTFPDADIRLPVYAVPSPTFNGRGSEGRDTGFDQKILAFGIDLIVERQDDPDLLYSHELFHIYHADAMGLGANADNEDTLTLSLWMEGFATFASQRMNPTASLEKVFMDPDLAAVSASELPWLAKEFRKVADRKITDSEDPGSFRKWFTLSAKYHLRKGLPGRCGYYLGYAVVAELAKSHSLPEMAHWNLRKARQEIIPILHRFAANKHG